MKKLFIHSFKTPLGLVRTAATEKGLAVVSLPGESQADFDGRLEKYFRGFDISSGGSINRDAEKQITKALNGNLKNYTLPLDVSGTQFQKKVLNRVAKIPFGRTATYGEIARAVGMPGAARAVGTANARNPLPLVIPCHRVVAANGLGGYGGGLKMKTRLLKIEGAL